MSRALALCAAALALAAAPCQAQVRDTLARGEDFFLTGKLDYAVNFFSGVAKENPKDSRAREILGYCLVIKGKEALREGKPGQALVSFGRAKEFLPDHAGLKTLALLAELEESAPTPSIPVSSATLNTAPETSAVLDCLFGSGECAKGGRYAVHVVREGETMAEIAIRYYNDLTLWEKIWAANPQLANPHRLEKGFKLLIPLDK
jgi:hypothetical protein